MSFYDLSDESKDILENKNWCCGYSGGKDSTSLVTWIEWLRRSGQIEVDHPQLVMSDTGVEFPALATLAHEMIQTMRESGWICEIIRPRRKDKLYVQIFGRGVTPVNPAFSRMRWCTAATKVAPMKRYRKLLGKDTIGLSAIRMGESLKRDEKIQKQFSSCSAGGECGVQQTSTKEQVYGPIMHWRLCEVLDWLQGLVDADIGNDIPDLQQLTKRLVRIYDFKKPNTIDLPMVEPEINSLRFGCIGCPAIINDKALVSAIQHVPEWKVLKGIHWIWDQLRIPYNRCARIKEGKVQYGPIKISVRKHFYEEMLRIQREAGISIITMKDDVLIRQMWIDGVYPRGWSEADERNVEIPEEGRIF